MPTGFLGRLPGIGDRLIDRQGAPITFLRSGGNVTEQGMFLQGKITRGTNAKSGLLDYFCYLKQRSVVRPGELMQYGGQTYLALVVRPDDGMVTAQLELCQAQITVQRIQDVATAGSTAQVSDWITQGAPTPAVWDARVGREQETMEGMVPEVHAFVRVQATLDVVAGDRVLVSSLITGLVDKLPYEVTAVDGVTLPGVKVLQVMLDGR